ncbi:MAG TPA: hypothetical protein VGF24_03575 [Vicinamibacterales bacterium]|jgi:hypothetical protein
MKAYTVATGVIFGLITIAHVWRMFEEPHLTREPWFLLLTAVSAALCLLAWRVSRRQSVSKTE